MDNDIRDFKEYELYPAIFGEPNRAFPDLHFRKDGKGWASEYHIDGTRDSKGDVTTHIYANNQSRAIDYARGNITLIDLYMSLNKVDFSTAYKELADRYGLSLPNFSREDEERYRQTQSSREAACKIFQAALWSGSPEAEDNLQYLHGRGWSDDIIRKAGLGLITTEIINSLPEEERDIYAIKEIRTVEENGQKVKKTLGGVGESHTLAIPYRAGSSLLGFTFRRIFERDENSQKYLNSKRLNKSWLLNIGVGAKDIVIVEGYLDALHAQAMGLENVVATTQAKAKEDMIQDALRRGVERFTLLYDMDKAGRNSIIPTIKAIHRLGGAKASIFVASLPDGKDTDEYLTRHTIEEFDREVVRKAVPYSHFVFKDIRKKYETEEDELGESTWKDREDFLKEVKRLLNSEYIKPTEREDIFRLMEDLEDNLSIKISDFREEADNEKALADAARQQNETAEVASKAYTLAKNGKTDEAIALMGAQASVLRAIKEDSDFSKLLEKPSLVKLRERRRNKPTGIATPYYFGQGDEVERLYIPMGAITLFCGATSHGKSAILQNLALDMASSQEDDGAVLYYTYEEEADVVLEQFENKFIGKYICKNNLRAITTYHSRGSFGEWVSQESLFYKREYDFDKEESRFEDFLSSGRLRIFYSEYDTETLIASIKYLCSQMKVKAVFIDYLQYLKLSKDSSNRQAEAKIICDLVKDLAVKNSLPIIAAAQFNREVRSPLEMANQALGEASDFEKIANVIVSFWNSSFEPVKGSEWATAKMKDDGKIEKQAKTSLQRHIEELGFMMGEPGNIYARLTKTRYGTRGLDTVLYFNGNTGIVKGNPPLSGAEKDFNGMSEINEDDDFIL